MNSSACSHLFHLLDFIVGTMFCIDSYFIISTANTLPAVALPLYYFAFGLIIIMVIFYAPQIIYNSIPFYWTFIGRSLCFILLSAPLISFGSTIDIATASTAAFIGFCYLLLSIFTTVSCTKCLVTLPPPILQRQNVRKRSNMVHYDRITKKKKNKTQKKWKYKEKQKNKTKKERKSLWRRITQYNKPKIEWSSGGTVADRLAKYNNSIKSDTEMKHKLNAMKKKKSEDIKTLDAERKQQATDALSQYAEKQVAHIKDINTLNAELKDINESNAVQKMVNMGLMRAISVKTNVFERYASRNMYANKLFADAENDNIDDNVNDVNDEEYTQMYVLNMMNCALLTKFTDEQKVEFEKLLLYSLKCADNLYIVELTRSNLNDVLLEKILNILINRSIDPMLFGPEEFKCESNKITNRGMKKIIEYIAINDKDLKVIKAGHLFTTISSEICKLCGEVLNEKNEYLLQLSIDIQWIQYQTQIDKGLKRNNNVFREQRKQSSCTVDADIMIIEAEEEIQNDEDSDKNDMDDVEIMYDDEAIEKAQDDIDGGTEDEDVVIVYVNEGGESNEDNEHSNNDTNDEDSENSKENEENEEDEHHEDNKELKEEIKSDKEVDKIDMEDVEVLSDDKDTENSENHEDIEKETKSDNNVEIVYDGDSNEEAEEHEDSEDAEYNENDVNINDGSIVNKSSESMQQSDDSDNNII